MTTPTILCDLEGVVIPKMWPHLAGAFDTEERSIDGVIAGHWLARTTPGKRAISGDGRATSAQVESGRSALLSIIAAQRSDM